MWDGALALHKGREGAAGVLLVLLPSPLVGNHAGPGADHRRVVLPRARVTAVLMIPVRMNARLRVIVAGATCRWRPMTIHTIYSES
jgi:hypothetical protein